jgi:hypothetical protein
MPTAAKRQAALTRTAQKTTTGSSGTARSPSMGQQLPQISGNGGGGGGWRRSVQWNELKGLDQLGLSYYQAMRDNGIAHQVALEVCQDAQINTRFGQFVNA